MARGGKREGAGRKPVGYVKAIPKPRAPYVAKVIAPKTCEKCSALFTPAQRGAKRRLCFDCAPVGGPVKQENKGTCKTCGKSLSGLSVQCVYCSPECYRTANIHRMRQRGVKLDAKDRSPRPCAHCGTIFELPYRSKNTVYCSKQCRTRAHAGSGCCHRRRARQFGVEYQYIHKHKVFVRDGWKCKICGIDTPKELKGTREPNAPELDHIVPMSKGGAHMLHNVQLACKRCNMTKGAKNG